MRRNPCHLLKLPNPGERSLLTDHGLYLVRYLTIVNPCAMLMVLLTQRPDMLTQKRLKQFLHYNPATGIFRWAVDRGGPTKIGTIAGCKTKDGYIAIMVEGKTYYAHVLAWLYMTGKWPKNKLDHRDVCGSNNVWGNLRAATTAQNNCNVGKQSNNKSGFKGVFWNKQSKKWCAVIRTGGKQIHLGYYNLPTDAHLAYSKAAAIYHKQFARAA